MINMSERISKTGEWYYDVVTDMEISNLFKYVKDYVKNKKVLDIGCGTGRYLENFSKDSVGIEVSHENIKIIKEKGLNVIFSDINNQINLKNNSFDIIFLSHVLEHVDSPINLLRECNRILDDEGMIFVSVPNENNILEVLKMDSYFDNHPEHLYSFSPTNLEVLLYKTGFQFEEIYVDLYLMKKFINKSTFFGGSFLDIIQKIPNKIILPFSSSYMIVAKKKL